MNSLQTHHAEAERTYTGVELRPHFLLTEFSLRGSAIGSFVGPCDVKTDKLVDWEDRIANDHIKAKRMVHFIGEFFGMSLSEAVVRQRLFMGIIGDFMNEELVRAGKKASVRRDGDDLFCGDRKLSVSIVTASPVSMLLHAGINVDPAGAPVPAMGLRELGLVADGMAEGAWAREISRRFSAEWESMDWACAKVRPVM